MQNQKEINIKVPSLDKQEEIVKNIKILEQKVLKAEENLNEAQKELKEYKSLNLN